MGDESILPYHFVIDDPAGNSYIKNLVFPQTDPNLKIEKYSRTHQQLREMGYQPENEEELIVKSEEEQNEALRKNFTKIKQEKIGAGTVDAKNKLNDTEKKAFEDFKNKVSTSKYSEKETKQMIHKVNEIGNKIHYSAHKTDFTKPLESTDVDGRPR